MKMKKIVALALCLVLALSLCATAFAAPTVYFGTNVGTATETATSSVSLSLEKYAAGSAAAHTVDTYKLWSTTVSTGAKVETLTTGNLFVISNADSYTNVFVSGTSITYLTAVEATDAYAGTATKVATVEFDDMATDGACGSYICNAALYKYTSNDGATTGYYYALTGTAIASATADDPLALVGDKVVCMKTCGTALTTAPTASNAVDTTYYVMPHTYKADVTTVAGKTTVTKVYCSVADCSKSFEFVVGTEPDAVAKFGAGNYEAVIAAGYNNTTAKTIYIKTGSATTGTTTSAVSSAKTFDAGIALYVGMSISAVAGSAVVIGKKKEF